MTPDEAKKNGFRCLTRHGKPEHGTILFFGQRHNGPENALKRHPDQHRWIIKSQQAILDDLLRFEPKRIFAEGVSRVVNADSADALNKLRSITQTLFKDYRPGSPLNDKQKYLLSELGVAETYFLLKPDVTLHGTTTPEAARRHEAYVEENWERIISESGITEKDRQVMWIERHKLAAESLRALLAGNPEQVALTYGASHEGIAEYCDEPAFSPQVFYTRYVLSRRINCF